MPESVSSQCRLFADDSIIYREISTVNDCTSLQHDLDALEKWEGTWGMSFNPSKCNVIHVSRKKKPLLHTYHIKDTDLEAVDIATYLGVEVSKELTWHKQVSKVAAKGNRVLGFVRRNITITSQCIKELAYKTLVRPVMEYSASVWSPHYKKLKRPIEMVQRRAARFVLHRYERKASVTDMILQLKWDTLEQRRLKARTVMMYRIIHNLVMIPADQLIYSTVNTRGHDMKLQTISVKRNYYKFSFFPFTIPLWNSISSDLASATTLDIFKKKLSDVQLKDPYPDEDSST